MWTNLAVKKGFLNSSINAGWLVYIIFFLIIWQWGWAEIVSCAVIREGEPELSTVMLMKSVFSACGSTPMKDKFVQSANISAYV